MKRKIYFFVILLAILCLFCSDIAFSNQYDFRKVNWGMSKKEVENTEQGTEKLLTKDENWLAYKEKVGGLECKLWYEFLHDKLILAYYVFQKEYNDTDFYIYDYRRLRALLKGKYGEPDTSFSDDPTEWEEGESSYWTLWFYPDEESPETGISLQLVDDTEQGKIILQIRYNSVN